MYDKVKALKNILSAAKIYDKELNGQDLLVLAKQGKNVISYNISFKSYHFKHFTGVDSNLSANTFYAKVLGKRLLASEFEFKDSFLVEKKMRVLENAMKLPYSAKMIGDFKYAGIKIEADIGAGSPQYVVAFRKDKQDGFYPVSVMEEDVRDSTQPTSPIVCILRKDSNDSIYNELTYKSKNINIDKLHIPKDLKGIIATDVMQQLKPQVNQEKEEKQPIKATSLSERIAQKKAIIEQRNSQRNPQHKDKSYNREEL